MTGHPERPRWTGYPCPTQKRAFFDRRAAKAAARSHRKAGTTNMHVYYCDLCSHWHIGHLPAAVVRGEVSTAEWYAQRDAANGGRS